MQSTEEYREGALGEWGEALFSGILKAKVTTRGTLKIFHQTVIAWIKNY